MRLLIALMLGICCCSVKAQDFKPISADINELQAQSSPAFTLLGISPASIARPLSPKEFRASILSSVAESDASIPDNLAIEFSPYWWKNRDVSFDQLFVEDDIGFNIKQSATYSLATSSTGLTPEDRATEFAVGARWTLRQGKASKKTLQASATVDSALEEYAIFQASNKSCQDWKKTIGADESDPNYIQCEKDSKIKNDVLIKSVDTFNAGLSRVGFQADIAVAAANTFPENSTSARRFSKGGIWLTTSYIPDDGEKGGLQYLGILRYLESKNVQGSNIESVDLGARILWSHNEEPIALSLEYLNRMKNNDKDAERYAAILEYQFSDRIVFAVSFGKDFRDETTTDDFFVVGGFNFNVGSGSQFHPM